MNRFKCRYLLFTLAMALGVLLATPAEAVKKATPRHPQAITLESRGILERLYRLLEVIFLPEGPVIDPDGLRRPLPPNSEQ